MSEVESNYNYGGLAKKRMLWAIKPIMGVIIVVWILHPSTADAMKDATSMQLKGFLVGAVYGLIIYREEMKKFWLKRRVKNTDIKNRVPDEYYMGHIDKVLRSKEEKEI